VTLIAVSQGLGPKQAAANPGVSTIAISAVSCSGTGVNVAINWPTLNQGPQFVYWSLQNNGWLAGTFSTQGPYAAFESNAVLLNLPESPAIYVMVGTVVGGVLDAGQTMVFSTAGVCSGAMAQGGGDLNFLLASCNLFHLGQPFSPLFFDDEDENQDEDEDENDFDEDEDDGDDFDEDEDEDDEGFDEDEDDDEDDEEVTIIVRRFGLPAFCHQLAHFTNVRF
jgi:hypothetical protein